MRIGSLNVRVKKTTEAFSHFLGVGNGNLNAEGNTATTGNGGHRPHQQRYRYHHHHHHHHYTQRYGHHHHYNHHHHPHHTRNGQLQQRPVIEERPILLMGPPAPPPPLSTGITVATAAKASNVQNNKNNTSLLHKSWGSVDNIGCSLDHDSMLTGVHSDTATVNPNDDENTFEHINKRIKDPFQYTASSSGISTHIGSIASAIVTDSPRDSISSTCSSNLNIGYSSMPTTPSQLRSSLGLGSIMDNTSGGGAIVDSDSDSACGFDSHWSVHKSNNSLTRRKFK